MNGITYFRLTSQYDGDTTKNCGLTGAEIDNNFYVLEGRDVKKVELENSALKVTLYNGGILYADLAPLNNGLVKDLSFDFDSENGVLKIYKDGMTQELTGFLTARSDDNVVFTDGTLKGNGKVESPLGISRAHRTGMYKPVKRIWNIEEDGELPNDAVAGDRYLVQGKISRYGRLFDYQGVMAIACDLAAKGNGWRIPTKAEWDDMFDALEPLAEKRNHTNPSGNCYLGQLAGGYLKSKDGWHEGETDGCVNISTEPCACGRSASMCNPTYCGEYASCSMRCNCRPDFDPSDNGGYGFDAVPTGFVRPNGQCLDFGMNAPFWTASMTNSRNSAYIKRVDWDKTSVYQDIAPTNMHYGLRLIKDYTGDNYFETEEILDGTYKTILMPSLKSGNKVWTAVNFGSLNGSYNGVDPGCEEGQDIITSEPFYYIAEWDGFRWVTSVFNEGDTVVVLVDGDNKDVEYRLYEDGLKDVNQAVIDSVTENIQSQLDELDGRVDALEEKVERVEDTLYDPEDGLVAVVGDEEEGLVKDVNDLKEDVAGLQLTVGDEDSGLVKDVNDLKESVKRVIADEGSSVSVNEEGVMQLNLIRENGETVAPIDLFDFNFGDI